MNASRTAKMPRPRRPHRAAAVCGGLRRSELLGLRWTDYTPRRGAQGHRQPRPASPAGLIRQDRSKTAGSSTIICPVRHHHARRAAPANTRRGRIDLPPRWHLARPNNFGKVARGSCKKVSACRTLLIAQLSPDRRHPVDDAITIPRGSGADQLGHAKVSHDAGQILGARPGASRS